MSTPAYGDVLDLVGSTSSLDLVGSSSPASITPVGVMALSK